ncbi:MAG: winged helix-turn-helix transcriptional regulator [Rhodospirillaceae bacterium]|nr:winged helix-turn-helix transcriptional regulator [Rhodospirillaceae bacterium]
MPTENVLAAIHVVSNRISRAFYADIEARHGITLPEWRVMLTLTRHPGMAAMAVADLWGMDKMAISRAVRRLEQAGLVVRTPAKGDRRRWVLELTPEGRRRYRAIEPVANKRYRDFLKPLDAGEAALLRQLLEKLIAVPPKPPQG